MADALLRNGNDLDSLRLDKTESESICTESSLDESSSSPKSIESDWSFTTFESKGSFDGDEDGGAIPVFGLNVNGDLSDKKSSIVDGLLFEIYDQYHARDSVDSDNITECSTTSGSFYGGSFDLEDRGEKWTRNSLQSKDLDEISVLAKEFKTRISMLSTKLVKQLKRRDKNAYKLQKNFDILTAVLQAVSLKRRVDTRIRFSFIPQSGRKSFRQWLDAFKAIARLPQGVPLQWRKRLWLCLAENKVSDLDWQKTVKFCFNEKSNPDDDELGSQIVKDLHRTGCAWFCGQDTPEERAALKRVLLAYARWNKSIGYCQGFNVIAALILQVMDRNEEDALKVMIYIVDHVLPTNYFSNNLRALSVDMAVLRDLMRLKLPRLSRHLEGLQAQATAHIEAASVYEPPLINVFTMQWFLTLFATCLPQETVLRVWDSVLLEGSEVLLRVALAIWAKLGERLEDVETSDEFYGKMGMLVQQIAMGELVDYRSVMQTVYSLAPFPLPGLAELREQYTYNIHPFSDAREKGSRSALGHASSDEEDEDIDLESVGCLGVLLPFSEFSPSPPTKSIREGEQLSRRAGDIAEASPGVFATDSYSPLSYTNKPFNREPSNHVNQEMNYLQKQYSRMRQMQQQAVVVFSEAAVQNIQDADKSSNLPTAINHLFVSATKKKPTVRGKGAGSSENESSDKDDIARAKHNAYERESMAHLNSLFKGDQKKENEKEKVEVRIKARSMSVPAPAAKPKLEHVGLNGEVCKLEAPKEPATSGHKSVSLYPSGQKSVRLTGVNTLKESTLKGSSSAVEILSKNSPSIMNSRGGFLTHAMTKTSSLSGAPNSSDDGPKSWLMQEDKRCKYPLNFKPFPLRSKAPGRSRILYGNLSDKGVRRMEAFHGKRDLRSPTNGNCVTEESKS